MLRLNGRGIANFRGTASSLPTLPGWGLPTGSPLSPDAS